MALNRKYFDLGIFILILAVGMLLFFFGSKLMAVIVLGGSILFVGGAILFSSSTLIPFIRYPKVTRTLQKYALIRETQFQKIIKIEPNRLHTILFQLSKTWNLSPLLIIVKNEYVFVHSKLINRVIPLVEDFEDKKGESHQDIIKKMGKLGKFKNREEMDAVIQILRKKL